LSSAVRIPIRIEGSTTSISLRKNIVALWILLNEIPIKNRKSKLVDFIYSCLDLWEGESAKGFSDFVSEKMVKGFLEQEDFKEYRKIMEWF